MNHSKLPMAQTIVAYTLYPVLMLTALWATWFLYNTGHSPMFSMLIPILCANLVIWAFEFIQPYNLAWRPSGKALRLDIFYATSTSLLITPLLKCGMLLLIVRFGITSSGMQIWPHNWPLYVQVILAILIADFFIYLAHRWMHLSPTGWKIHVIHHSTERMHFWAGSRSHILNVILIYTGEVGALLLLGVNTEVLIVFTVFTAINGVIEHSNIELRFGFLNRILSTAELHRVHHSTDVAVGNHNFGTATCIWDQIFGTYLLPDEPVRIQGILGHRLPESYWQQLKAPFMLRRYEVKVEDDGLPTAQTFPTVEAPAGQLTPR